MSFTLLGRWLFGLEGIFASGAVCNLLLALLAWWWLGQHIHEHQRLQTSAQAATTAGLQA